MLLTASETPIPFLRSCPLLFTTKRNLEAAAYLDKPRPAHATHWPHCFRGRLLCLGRHQGRALPQTNENLSECPIDFCSLCIVFQRAKWQRRNLQDENITLAKYNCLNMTCNREGVSRNQNSFLGGVVIKNGGSPRSTSRIRTSSSARSK